MVRYEAVAAAGRRSDLCLVVGDVTSTMACAIAAQKLGVPVAHVEAGIRSRRLDHARGDQPHGHRRHHQLVLHDQRGRPTRTCAGPACADERIFFVGNTMIDTLLANLRARCAPPAFWDERWPAAGRLLRDDAAPARQRRRRRPRFARLLAAVRRRRRAGLPVVFPVHPRTARRWQTLRCAAGPTCVLVDPQPYLEFNYLVRAREGRDHRLRRHHRGDHRAGRALHHAARQHRAAGNRDARHQRADRHRPGALEARARPPVRRPLEDRARCPSKWDGRAGERIVAELDHLLCA